MGKTEELQAEREKAMVEAFLASHKVTKCKAGGAYNHKPMLRTKTSRNYGGAVNIGKKLKEMASHTQDALHGLMGLSSERLYNLEHDKGGAVISTKSKNKIRKLKRYQAELTKDANELMSYGKEAQIISEPKYIGLKKKSKKPKGYEGAHGISAYTAPAETLQELFK